MARRIYSKARMKGLTQYTMAILLALLLLSAASCFLHYYTIEISFTIAEEEIRG